MIADFFFIIWAVLIAVPIYWAIPVRWGLARIGLLSLVSLTLIAMLSPVALLALAGFLGLIAIFRIAQHNGVDAETLKLASWFVFAPLLLFEFVPGKVAVQVVLGAEWLELPTMSVLAFAGTSYMAIRSFIIIRENLAERGPNFFEAFTTLSFFGSFLAGPISGSQPYRERKSAPEFSDITMGFARIGWGGALFLYFKPLIASLDPAVALGIDAAGITAAWLETFQHFIVLYIDFTGYTDIAIGLAMLFGIRLPENFNFPLRSTSMQEFWQRWHMSLGAFIGTYLFKPLVRHFGKPPLAIFVAFCAVGLWHEIAPAYFLWGVGHGAALAANMKLKKALPTSSWPTYARTAQKVLGWCFVMTYVSLLSAFATSPSLSAALALMARLFGLD